MIESCISRRFTAYHNSFVFSYPYWVMFEDIVNQLAHSYSESQRYCVNAIDETAREHGTLAAVDGGAAILWSNTVQSIGIILSGFMVYDEQHRITHHSVNQKEVLTTGDTLDILRMQCELAQVRAASHYSDCVLFDGALLDIPGTGFKSLLDTIDEGVTVMGISKKTRLDTLKKGIPDTETMDYPGTWYYHIPSPTLGRTYRPLGEVYIAKLHERGPSFRVDVKGTPNFYRLVYYSKYLFCLGYPYPLLEIHKATTLRDKTTYFQLKLQETMTHMGLEREYLSGLYQLEKEREEFHQVIDGLT